MRLCGWTNNAPLSQPTFPTPCWLGSIQPLNLLVPPFQFLPSLVKSYTLYFPIPCLQHCEAFFSFKRKNNNRKLQCKDVVTLFLQYEAEFVRWEQTLKRKVHRNQLACNSLGSQEVTKQPTRSYAGRSPNWTSLKSKLEFQTLAEEIARNSSEDK